MSFLSIEDLVEIRTGVEELQREKKERLGNKNEKKMNVTVVSIVI